MSTSLDKVKGKKKMPDVTAAPPFLLRSDEVESLSESEGFNLLRGHLVQHLDYEYVSPRIVAHFTQLPLRNLTIILQLL